jgi:ABC-type transporter Mla subunit MlaD
MAGLRGAAAHGFRRHTQKADLRPAMQTYRDVVDWIASLIGHFDDRYKGFAAVLLVLALGLALWLLWIRRRHRTFQRTLIGTSKEICRIADGAETTADKLALADKRLRDTPQLAHIWGPYRRSLRPDPRIAGDYINPISPHAWFCLERIPGRGYEKWAATFAGVFLTIGLLFTFVGLSAALFKIHDLGNDTDQLRRAISDILKIASAKFITSIAGIVAYIAWTVAARYYVCAQAKAADALANAIQLLSTPVTPEAILLDQAEETRAQTTRLKSLGDEIRIGFQDTLTTVVGQRLDALPDAIRPTIAPVVDAIRGISTNIGDGNKTAIQGMVDGLLQKLTAEIAEVSATMKAAATAIGTAQTGIDASGDAFKEKLGEAAQRMADAAARMSEAMDGRIGDLEGRIKSIGETLMSGAGAIGQMSDKMAQDLTASLASAVEEVRNSASSAAVAARDSVHAQIGSVLESLQAVVQQIQVSATASKAELVAGGRGAAAELQGAVLQAGDTLARSSEKIADDIAMAFGRANTSIVANVEGAVGQFADKAAALSARLGGVEENFLRVEGALRRNAERIGEASVAMGESGRTVSVASDSLRQAAGPVAAALQAVDGVVKQAATTLSTVQAATETVRQTLGAVQAASTRATETFRSYEQRFGEVDERLGALLSKMRQGVIDLADQMSGALIKSNDQLTHVVNSLAKGTDDLRDAVTNIGRVCGDIERVAGRVEQHAAAMAGAD